MVLFLLIQCFSRYVLGVCVRQTFHWWRWSACLTLIVFLLSCALDWFVIVAFLGHTNLVFDLLMNSKNEYILRSTFQGRPIHLYYDNNKHTGHILILLWIHRGSNMSVRTLLNSLNKLRKMDKMRWLLSIFSLFLNKFNRFNNTGIGMLHSIYHMTLQLHWNDFENAKLLL